MDLWRLVTNSTFSRLGGLVSNDPTTMHAAETGKEMRISAKVGTTFEKWTITKVTNPPVTLRNPPTALALFHQIPASSGTAKLDPVPSTRSPTITPMDLVWNKARIVVNTPITPMTVFANRIV